MPQNIRSLHLPAYSPELNPVERLWAFLKSRYLSSRVYRDDRDTQASLAGSSEDLYIGASSTLAPGRFWSGLIDDVRIYNRAVAP